MSENTNSISNSQNQFRFIKTKPGLIKLKSKNQNFIYSTLFYILIVMPLIIIFVLLVFFKFKKVSDSDLKGYKSRRANKLAKKYLSEAKIKFAKERGLL